jgi:uncharacterized protein (DUF983 family)
VPVQPIKYVPVQQGFGMTDSQAMTMTAEDMQERPLGPALMKGFRRRCPNCGKGALLHSFLKVNDRCSVCDQDLSHSRADDAPAYLTILLVGHLMAPLLHIVFVRWRPEPLIMFTIFAVGCVALSLYLLPRLKGVVVAFQWARRMHGFGTDDR